MLIAKKCTLNGILAVLVGLLVFSSCEDKWQRAWIYGSLPEKLWESECEKIVTDEYLRICDMLEDYADEAVDEYEDIETYDDLEEYLATYMVASLFGMEDLLPDFGENQEARIEEYESHLEEVIDILMDNMLESLPLRNNPSRPETIYSDEALCEILLGTPAAIANPPADVQQNIARSIVTNLLVDRNRPSVTSCSYDRKKKVWNVRLDNAPNQTVSFFKRDDGDYDIEWTGTKGYIPSRQEANNRATQGNGPTASGEGREYYVDETFGWTPNADSSCYLTIASTDKSDVDGTNEFIDWNGDRTLVCADKPGGKLEPVLAASQLTGGAYITPIPSTFDPNTVYFFYTVDGQEFPNSGKVDLETKKFNVLEGSVIGMITRGTYKDCVLMLTSDGVKVLKQAKVGQNDKLVKSFSSIQEYFPGHANHQLDYYDSKREKSFTKDVINWLESQ